jgi:hypothetical protein
MGKAERRMRRQRDVGEGRELEGQRVGGEDR